MADDQQISLESNRAGNAGSMEFDRASARSARFASGTARGQVASWVLFAVAALAPLPFGSNVPTAIAFWCVVLGFCLVLAPIPSLSAGQLALAGLASFVVIAYAFVLHEQLAEHPWIAAPDPIWHTAERALGVQLVGSVSVTRNQPWFELGRPLVSVLAVVCGFVVGQDRIRARQLILVIAWSGAAYAAYGFLSYLFDPTQILGRDKTAYLDSLTGTFINRNTAGAYFGSCAVVWSLLLWERIQLSMPAKLVGWRAVTKRLFSAMPKPVVVAFAMLFLCLSAMFMTRSRGAAVLSLLALVIGFTLFLWQKLPRRTGLMAAVAGGGLGALLLLQLMGEGVNARFDVQGLSEGGRLETYRSTLNMIADHPWFGTGQGTFAAAFPAYRSPDPTILWVWDMAHNTLLEIAADMGLPIATLVTVAWLTIFVILIRGALIRHRDNILPVAAFSVGILGVLHSLTDFSLQIPGYAIMALSLIGAGLAQSFSTRRVPVRP